MLCPLSYGNMEQGLTHSVLRLGCGSSRQLLRLTEWWHCTLQRPRSRQRMGFRPALRHRGMGHITDTFATDIGLSASGTTAPCAVGTSSR